MAKYKVTMTVDIDGRPSCGLISDSIKDALSEIDIYIDKDIVVENYSSNLQISLEEYIGDNLTFIINNVDFSEYNINIVVYLDIERYKKDISEITMTLDKFLEIFDPVHFIFVEAVHDSLEEEEVYLDVVGRKI